MKLGSVLFTVCIMITMLSGCWDQQLLNQDKIAYVLGFDLTPDGKIQSTTSLLDIGSSQSGSKQVNEIHSVIGNTSRHTRELIDREVSGRVSSSKLRVILIGEELAKQGIYPILDVFYRDPKSALNARIAVVEGSAHDAINLKLTGTSLVGEYFYDLVRSAEQRTIVPKVNLQLVCSSMLDPGQDFAAPYISKNNEHPSIAGAALFQGDMMRGTLNTDESLLYMLMKNQLSKTASLTVRSNKEGEQKPENYITLDIQKIKRTMKVGTQGHRDIDVRMNIKLKVTAIEYPRDHLYNLQKLDHLDEELSDDLTRKANVVIDKMLQAHHDGFEIGRRLIAFHSDTWSNLNWKEDYSKVEFSPHVDVEIVNYGIMN